MTPSERITEAAWRAVTGQLDTPTEPGLCLQAVRVIVEHGLNLGSFGLYDHWVTDWVQPQGYDRADGHWARDAERSMRNLGWALSGDRARPGDLLFNWRAAWSEQWGAWIGHVAILLEHDLILENVHPAYRPHSLHRGALCLTPRRYWGEATTVIRIPPEALEDM